MIVTVIVTTNGTAMKQLTEKEATVLVEQFGQMAKKISFDLGRKYQIHRADIQQEAISLLYLIVAEWNTKGKQGFDRNRNVKPSTYIYSRLYNGLRTWCERRQIRETVIDEHQINRHSARPSPSYITRLLLELNRDAQIVVKTIINAPAEIADEIMPDRRYAVAARKAVMRYLGKEGWSQKRVERAWNEVALAL